MRYQKSLLETEMHLYVEYCIWAKYVGQKCLATFPCRLQNCKIIFYIFMALVFISVSSLDSVNLNVKTHFMLLVALRKGYWSKSHSFEWKSCQFTQQFGKLRKQLQMWFHLSLLSSTDWEWRNWVTSCVFIVNIANH